MLFSLLSLKMPTISILEFFFDPNSYPSNFSAFLSQFPDFRVGVVTYNNFFTHEELTKLEDRTYITEKKCFSGNIQQSMNIHL